METKKLSILNVNIDDPVELARFREEQAQVLAERKRQIVSEHRRLGQLDEHGNWIFRDPTPEDMLPGSPADFKH